MTRFDLSASPFSHIGFAPTSDAQDIKWIRPDRPAYLAPPIPETPATERSERAKALIVIVLTLACTVLAIFDLILLASGS